VNAIFINTSNQLVANSNRGWVAAWIGAVPATGSAASGRCWSSPLDADLPSLRRRQRLREEAPAPTPAAR